MYAVSVITLSLPFERKMRSIVYYVDVLMRLVPPEFLSPKVRLRQRIEQVHKVPWRSQMYFDGETAILDGKY